MSYNLQENRKILCTQIDKTIEKSNLRDNIINIILKLNNNSNYYLDTEKIENQLNLAIKNILTENSFEIKNLCVECNIDMGKGREHRQLCGKTRCLYKEY
tara:strand:+ start:3129 stop:3428 length:300 start_codon:yes stop_codon:yes gene_type:complete